MTNNSGETGEPWGVPTETGANILGEPWYRRRHVLSDRKDLVHDTKYGLTPLALSMPQREEVLTLSKPLLMSRTSVETFLWAIWSERTSCVKVVIASEPERPAKRIGGFLFLFCFFFSFFFFFFILYIRC